MQTIKERLNEFLKEMGISQARFAQRVGLSRSYAQTLSDNITQSTLEKIQAAYPNLNIDWLTKGSGEMFNNHQTATNNSLSNSNLQQGNYINDLALLYKFQEDYKAMSEQKDKHYMDIINKKDEQINELLGILKQLSIK